MAQRIAIIGHAAEKFTKQTETKAKILIQNIFLDGAEDENPVLVSGRSPMGGIDVWAEEVAIRLGYDRQIFPPKRNQWESFKERNLEIARSCDVMYVIVVEEFPPEFKGKKFRDCYHCIFRQKRGMPLHIKSGACWTANKAIEHGIEVKWLIIAANGTIKRWEE